MAYDCDVLPLPFGASTDDDSIDLTLLAGEMSNKGWILLGTHVPKLINLPIDAATDEKVVDTFLQDLRDTCAGIKSGRITQAGDLRYG